jgi:hypothetical protein
MPESTKIRRNFRHENYENIHHSNDVRRPDFRVGIRIRSGLRQVLQQMLQILRDLREMQKERLQNLLQIRV